MHVKEKPGGKVVSRKFSTGERVLGVVMIVAAFAVGTLLVFSRNYNFWFFGAQTFLLLFLLIPGAFFTFFRNEVVIDPASRELSIRRGWFIPHAVAEYEFEQVLAVLCAMREKGRRPKPIFLWQIVIRLEDGGLLFNAAGTDKEKTVKLGKRLAEILDKPLKYMKENPTGDGLVAAD